MLNRDYEGQNCSIARALEVVGERWTLLIIRDVLLGLHRFDEFQESLGIARNVLTDRLNRLVDEGVLERVLYSERPERYEYQLTKKGLDLNIALTALRQWGDRWRAPDGPPLQLLHRECGHITELVPVCAHCHAPVGPTDVSAIAAPGYLPTISTVNSGDDMPKSSRSKRSGASAKQRPRPGTSR